jgi:flagellar basal body-associated protein FliL
MTKHGLRKTAAERQAEKQKQKKNKEKLVIGAVAVTTASAMVAAIYAACRALEEEKHKEADEADQSAQPKTKEIQKEC